MTTLFLLDDAQTIFSLSVTMPQDLDGFTSYMEKMTHVINEHWVEFLQNLGFSAPAFVQSGIEGVFRSDRMQLIFQRYGTVC